MDSSNPQAAGAADLKLEVLQFADIKLHKIKDDLRELLAGDLKSHKEALDWRNQRYVRSFLAILALLGVGNVVAVYQGYQWVNAKMVKTLDEEVGRVRAAVSERLDQEFETKRIRTLIEDKTRQYTETRARQFIAERVEGTIKPLTDSLTRSIVQANAEVEQLRYFVSVEGQVRFGSFAAYEELSRIAAGQTANAPIAKRQVAVIERDMGLYRTPPGFFESLVKREDGKEIPIGQVPTADLFKAMEDPTMTERIRHTVMAYLVGRPKEEIAREALKLLKGSDSLPAIAASCGILAKVFGDKAKFLDRQRWIEVLQRESK